MTMMTFEGLLDQADAAAKRSDWQEAHDALSNASDLEPENPGVLTGLGTCLLRLGRPEEALPHFQKAAALAPNSAEAQNNLGVASSLAGLPYAAEAAYQNAVELDPDHLQAWKNLALVYLNQDRMLEGVEILAALVQTHPDDVDALFLLAQCYEEGKEYSSARTLYQEVLKNQPDHAHAKEALERLPKPVLDPSRIARPEHAKKLAALKGLVNLKKPAPTRAETPPQNGKSTRYSRAGVAFYGPAEAATEMRLGPVVHSLDKAGYKVKVSLHFEPEHLDNFDTYVFACPHSSQNFLEGIARCKQARKRIIIDLDQDFLHIPEGYPGYEQVGPGNPQALLALESVLVDASLVTVPTQILAERYQIYNQHTEVLPYSLDRSNPLWEKPVQPRTTVNLGIVATHTAVKDAAVLKQAIARILREYPQTLLVIGAHLPLYEAFRNIPENRRLFLPAGRMEDYPFMLANFDILLVPLQKNEYNQAKSALPLLEAGERGIPWIASPNPAFEAWGEGGVFAEGRGEWYESLKLIVEDRDYRINLGKSGHSKARQVDQKTIRLWEGSVTKFVGNFI